MKKLHVLLFAITSVLSISFATAQTADEIIANYIKAIGGKELLTQLNSVYMEGTMDAMGNKGSYKTTLLNGKGYKQEIDVMGTQVVMCVTDSMGWQINPMSGSYNAEKMADAQYLPSRNDIYAGGLFTTDYASKGYKIDLAGQETVVNVNAWKIDVTAPDNSVTSYFFDPDTWYLIKTINRAEMMGQSMDIATNFSNYKKLDNGYASPSTVEVNYGGQFFLTANFTKIELNNPVDPAIFAKP
ncbi:MAG TPA: hypothetical protein VK179_00110 [Bacteroidales bacterium]|nr:hypothetical protein [Bacteroidales bacterium]